MPLCQPRDNSNQFGYKPGSNMHGLQINQQDQRSIFLTVTGFRDIRNRTYGFTVSSKEDYARVIRGLEGKLEART